MLVVSIPRALKPRSGGAWRLRDVPSAGEPSPADNGPTAPRGPAAERGTRTYTDHRFHPDRVVRRGTEISPETRS